MLEEIPIPREFKSLDEYIWHLDQLQLFDMDGPIGFESLTAIRIECIYIDTQSKQITNKTSHWMKWNPENTNSNAATISSLDLMQFMESRRGSSKFKEARLFHLPLYFQNLPHFLKTSATQIALEYTKPIEIQNDLLLPPSLPIFHHSHMLCFLYRSTPIGLAKCLSANKTKKHQHVRFH